MKSFDEFKNDFQEDLGRDAIANNCLEQQQFTSDMLGILTDASALIDPEEVQINKTVGNRKICIDAVSFDGSDKSVILVYFDYSREDVNLTKTDIEKYSKQMLAYVDVACNGRLKEYFDMFSDEYIIGNKIKNGLNVDYVSDTDEPIDRIMLMIVTNKKISERIKELPEQDYKGRKVTVSVWGLERLYDFYKSGRERESIEIELPKYGYEKGIPCLKAEMTGNLDYDAYLAIIPGELLHEINYDYGARLLEGNVRAFLSNRSKINKGIRNTIKKEPTKFFTYNNGIACTAESITLSEDGTAILGFKDLQIINGGQTTASLTSAKNRDKSSLDNIFVPMKVTVVKQGDYEDMIQSISKYANSQNKVTDADLFSNHPFHRWFEDRAKSIQTPPKPGELYGSYWYYERSRGKYDQEKFNKTSKLELAKFESKFPKNQVIKKEELAKYYTAAALLRPDIVSKHSNYCMKYFAEYIDGRYTKHKEEFNDTFYRLCICYVILFKGVDKIVKNAGWYNVGGYKLNIVPYTVSKLLYSIPNGKTLDYNLIWKTQDLYSSLKNEIDLIAQDVNGFIKASNGRIVTEYCKDQKTWNAYKEIKHEFTPAFKNDLVSEEILNSEMNGSKKEEKLANEINIAAQIVDYGSDYWLNLREEGIKRHLLTNDQAELLRKVSTFVVNGNPRLSNKQLKLIWDIRRLLSNNGVLVD